MPHLLAGLGAQPLPEHEEAQEREGQEVHPVLRDGVAQGEQDLGRDWQQVLLAAIENGEPGQDEGEHEHARHEGEREHDGGVGQGAPHLPDDLLLIAQVTVCPLDHAGQHPALLAGADKGHEDAWKALGIAGDGRREIIATAHGNGDLLHDLPDVWLVGLAGDAFEGVGDGDARFEHDRELGGELHQLAAAQAGANFERGGIVLARLLGLGLRPERSGFVEVDG